MPIFRRRLSGTTRDIILPIKNVYCYDQKKEIKQKFLQNLTNSVNFLQIETEQHTIFPSLFENIQMYF